MAKTQTCYDCAYAHWDKGQWLWSLSMGVATRPACANHPESLGRMRPAAIGGGVCRNFRPKAATPKGQVKQIPLGDGFYAYVDAIDYGWLSRWTWHLRDGYAVRYRRRKAIYMHREIMQPPKGKIVDHMNRNRLDNTRANLRVCTRPENARNKGKLHATSSRFRGVSYRKCSGKWAARIRFKGKCIHLGYFTDEEEAARAYDRKAVELFGEFARLNFPEEWPARRRRRAYAKRSGGKSACARRRRRASGKAAKPRKVTCHE